MWLGEVKQAPLSQRVAVQEVEEVFANHPRFRLLEAGGHEREGVYIAFGQTNQGRHLSVLFTYRYNRDAWILSSRDMADWEWRQYGQDLAGSLLLSSAHPLPEFHSVDEMVSFFERHDLGEYWRSLPEVTFGVQTKHRKFLVPVEERTYCQLLELAQLNGISAEGLLNLWLKEKLET